VAMGAMIPSSPLAAIPSRLRGVIKAVLATPGVVLWAGWAFLVAGRAYEWARSLVEGKAISEGKYSE
jgi:hypothetical protein